MKNERETTERDDESLEQTSQQNLLAALLCDGGESDCDEQNTGEGNGEPRGESAPLEELAEAASLASVPELMEFVAEHPDVYDLPRDVLQLLAEGRSLREAWEHHENDELRARLAERENRRRGMSSPGSMSGDAGLGDSALGGLIEAFNAAFC